MIPARVLKSWTTIYADPLTVRAGEALAVGRRDDEWPGWVWCTNAAGQSGWAPEGTFERRGADHGVATRDYTARELSAAAGAEVAVHFQENGWCWAEDRAGRTGWLPATHLELNRAPSRRGAGA